ncbi:DNA-binding anti-repressor SinI [Siminovitchia fortis]|uniref:DNA-binding anti-repressor SinI n=1 Tax=Siminovitchia fortis TaxID=254758 RepID=A0A443J3K0_9BACI|nr:DNA-binding anti-repressor SinI [Siminovitchia fortis]RWR15042.1 DNA-binding anti-repressor SinI [Siminovitchia fortis]WHY82820.1 DNA-binding anti-repressor SinI [Siminovitchia fortis]
MGEYKGDSQYLDLDYEWVLLLKEAKQLNMRKEEIRIFFKSKGIERELLKTEMK